MVPATLSGVLGVVAPPVPPSLHWPAGSSYIRSCRTVRRSPPLATGAPAGSSRVGAAVVAAICSALYEIEYRSWRDPLLLTTSGAYVVSPGTRFWGRNANVDAASTSRSTVP